MMTRYKTSGSEALYKETAKYLAGGVASSFQKGAAEQYPICFTKAKGSHMTDVDGNDYIDYIAGLCPMLLGYANDTVNAAVREQLAKGTHFAATTPQLVELSKKLCQIIPSAEIVSFENSGTEANMFVFRVARAYTKKMKIVKFEGQYHGWADEQKVSIDAAKIDDLGEREAPLHYMPTKGMRTAAADDILVLPWNDADAVEELLKRQGDEIAAVIMEPFMCDNGPIPPLPGYLQKVRELTEQFGVLLIFDEVITGFRLAPGGAQELFGVTPDLSVFAKAATAGFPLAFIAGKKEIMQCGVPASGTFNGHPLAAAAANAAIEIYRDRETYEHLNSISKKFSDGLRKLSEKHNIALITEHFGGLVTLTFTKKDRIVDFRDWLNNADVDFYNKFNAACRDYGIRLTNKKGRLCVSSAHTPEDIEKTLSVMDIVLDELCGK